MAEHEAESRALRERRRYVRVSGRLTVAYRLLDEGTDTEALRAGILESISIGGALIEIREPLKPGTRILIQMPIPSMLDGVSAEAEVLRVEPHEGEEGVWAAAIEFRDVPFADLKKIADFIDDRLAQSEASYEYLMLKLDLLQELSQVLHASLDLDSILNAIMDIALRIVDAESGTLMLINPETQRLEFTVAKGPKAEELKGVELEIGEGIAGWVALHGRPVNAADIATDKRWRSDIAKSIGYQTSNMLCVPLKIRQQPIGVIEVMNKIGHDRFTADDMRTLMALASQASIVIENARLYNELEKAAEEANRVARQASEQAAAFRRAAARSIGQAVVVALPDGAIHLNRAAQSLAARAAELGSDVFENACAIVRRAAAAGPGAFVDGSVEYIPNNVQTENSDIGQGLVAHLSALEDEAGNRVGVLAHLVALSFEPSEEQ